MQGAPEASPPAVGLVLTGGGARAAYQVGVLSAVLDILDPKQDPGLPNPFPIICGTSAGAINAAALACRAHQPHVATDRLRQLWGGLSTGRIYYADAPRLLRTGVRWLGALSLGWLSPKRHLYAPRFLLDNTPLRALLTNALDFSQLQRNLDAGRLQAVAVTASDYVSGHHVTFYQSHQTIAPWKRTLRRAQPDVIGVNHLMASSAIPFIFPAQAIRVGDQVQWCGDGAMRQLAPISPLIHLGAHKVFVIGTGFQDETRSHDTHPTPYPSLAQIGGHALANIFLDSVPLDIERVERVNALLAQSSVNGLKPHGLRHLDVLAVSPSQSLEALAMRHLAQAPKAVRALFRVLGVSGDSGSSQAGGVLVSYLLFERDYTQALMALGHADCMHRREEVEAFFKETRA